MRILFLLSSMATGGAERVAARLASAWADRGDHVTLVMTYAGEKRLAFPLHPNVKVVSLLDSASRPGIRIFEYARKIRLVRSIAAHERVDVVVSFLTNVNVLALIALAGVRTPVIVSERVSSRGDIELPTVLRLLRAATYRWADIVVVQSAHSVRTERHRVIPNPAPESMLVEEARRSADDPPRRRHRVISVGRLTTQKRYDLLIHAFAAVANQIPEWDLAIAGDGPLRKELEALAHAVGLQNRVRFLGFTDNVLGELTRSDMFVLCSDYEGFPNALMEAMACGLPCIATDCPTGPHELTQGGQYGLLIPCGDRQALSGSLLRLALHPQLRHELGEGARQQIDGRFSLLEILKRWDELFAEVLHG